MTREEIDLLFESASKVLHFDKSHDAIRQKLQASISAQHRVDNASNDSSSSYYNTPYVRDVFGTETDGQVVHSQDGNMTLSNYKQDKKGGYALSNPKKVKHAYVVAADPDKATEGQESLQLLIDGKEVEVKESNAPIIVGEVLELAEADAKSSTAKITLITAGKGSMGYYTEAALKKAAKDGIFSSGTHMFLNHQTKEERLARPEGDVTKLAGILTGKAEYVEGAAGKPGRLLAPAKIYPEFSPFISARKSDIGVSVRVGAENSGKMQEGVPLVENMLYALSTDFVTKAGRGGKIEELYESYRANPAFNSGDQPHEGQMTDEEKKMFETLQEGFNDLKKSNAALTVQVDRLAESNSNLSVTHLITEALNASGLKPRGQERIKKLVLSTAWSMKDGTIDVAKLQETVAAAIKDEQEYLAEAGGNTRQSTVQYLGASGIKLMDEAKKPRKEAEVVKEASNLLSESINSILGIEKEEVA